MFLIRNIQILPLSALPASLILEEPLWVTSRLSVLILPLTFPEPEISISNSGLFNIPSILILPDPEELRDLIRAQTHRP
jgi:hypothetical protein